MPIPVDKQLYEEVKQEVKEKYDAPRSPFLSGAIVNEYKKRGGKYINDSKEKKLTRWFDEKWVNINPLVGKNKDAYAFFRPTVKVSKKTSTLAQDISKNNLKKYVKDEQDVKYGKQVEKHITGGMIVRAQPYSKSMFPDIE